MTTRKSFPADDADAQALLKHLQVNIDHPALRACIASLSAIFERQRKLIQQLSPKGESDPNPK